MTKGRKTGGRHKGTPNKHKGELLKMIQELYPDYHPLVALAKLAMPELKLNENGVTEEVVNKQMQFLCHREIAKYVVPRPRPVGSDQEDQEDGMMLLSNDELLKRITEILTSGTEGGAKQITSGD